MAGGAGSGAAGEAGVPGLVRPPASGVAGPSGAPDVPVPDGVTAEGAADGAAEGAGSSDQSRYAPQDPQNCSPRWQR
ncbi:hypothetical protein [Actinacidiphila epipremni]|uniref:Uncharacterized protein n=1 Tax=Actinacidiphila epipremni TaxID=2053013 RepID=A0ABX0ZU95_9ACTN|nr:hypothetical protein [Actinacidiphila epipremni]NJP46547.1 hypothetical protein [Actinacidiphila epipremni]